MAYRRTTLEVPLASLAEPLASALRKHATQHQLELGGARAFLTHSENPPATGFFGKLLGRRDNPVDPDVAHDSVLVLHATHLLVGTAGEKRGVAILSVPLGHASVTRGSALALQLGMESEDGVTITGFPGEHGRPATYFFGLGPTAADECFAAVEAAIRAAKNPR